MTKPVRPLEALIGRWVGRAKALNGSENGSGHNAAFADALFECADELAALLQAAAPPAPTAELCPSCGMAPLTVCEHCAIVEHQRIERGGGMTETEKELNAWRELGEEMGRVISLMDAETFADWFPDWFGPRLFDLQVQGSAAAPPAPTAEPRYTESSIRQFIGWLSADIPALNSVLVPDLADSWERFKQRMLGAAPPERVSEGKESTCQSPSDGTKTTSSEPAKKDAPNAATHLSRMPGVALRAAATSGDAQPVNERGSLKSETDAARPAVEPREEPRR